MKKHTNIIFALAALLMAAMVSCTKEEQPVSGKFTMTVHADKGTRATKDLAIDGSTGELTVKWKEGETVKVYKGTTATGDPIGTLTVSSVSDGGARATLSGNVEAELTTSDKLTLEFCSQNYNSQNGTLAYIAANCDYATATVDITDLGGGSVTTTDATFTNQQAIVRFTLKKSDGSALPSNPSAFTVTDGANTVSLTSIPAATYTANGDGVLYVAFPAAGTAKTITLTATVGSDTYSFEKSGVTFTNGQYYTVSVKMSKLLWDGDLAKITSESTEAFATATDGMTITGTLGVNKKISIADGATVTLNNVTINGSGTWTSGNYAGITCAGDATITLEGTNTVKGFANGYPGIFVSSGKTLVINGTGELNASSNGSYNTGSGGAGIGGGDNMNCGNIEIQSGTVTATGNQYGAGIGGGQNANCGNITISGGTVTATGGYRAAGIGGGRRGVSGTSGQYNSGSCGNISISGGTVNATGGADAAGIGGGRGNNNNYKSSCGNITITSGVTSVTATKGEDATYSIGAGSVGTCGTVTIGGVVTGPISDSPYTYPVPLSYPIALGDATSDYVGSVVTTDGYVYATVAAASAASKTAVAMIAYVSGTGHGLVLALEDEGQMDWNTAVSTCSGKTPTISGTTWKLASQTEWNNMITAAGSYTALRDGFSSFGGTNMNAGTYWSSTDAGTYYGTQLKYGYKFNLGSWGTFGSTYAQNTRACLAF